MLPAGDRWNESLQRGTPSIESASHLIAVHKASRGSYREAPDSRAPKGALVFFLVLFLIGFGVIGMAFAAMASFFSFHRNEDIP
jgi:hypothetical protein